MDRTTLLTEMYCKIDDILQQEFYKQALYRPGTKPILTDSEIITLSIYQEFTSYTKEDDFWKFTQKYLRGEFPNLIDRSQYNRRKRDLWNVMNLIRFEILKDLHEETDLTIFDTIPIPVSTYTKGSNTKRFYDANFGLCASKNMKYFGYKIGIHVSTTGTLLDFELGSASPHDINYAESILTKYSGIVTLADKAMLSDNLQTDLKRYNGVILVTPKKSNSKEKNTRFSKYLLRKFRNIIETVGSQLSNLFNIEKTWAKTQWGVFARVMSKFLAYTFGLYINKKYNLEYNNLDQLMNLM